MQRTRLFGLAIIAAITWSGTALAEKGPFPAGTIALGAERISGFYHANLSTSVGGQTADVNVDELGLLGLGATGPWSLPRVGIDGFVTDGLSLGGTLFIGYTSANVGFTSIADTKASATDILLAPRVGYAVMFSDSVGIWPRGGFSYFHESISPDQGPSESLHFISLVLDAPFIFQLTKGFAITAGPTIDVSLGGSFTRDAFGNQPAQTIDEHYTAFGISAGLLGWL